MDASGSADNGVHGAEIAICASNHSYVNRNTIMIDPELKKKRETRADKELTRVILLCLDCAV